MFEIRVLLAIAGPKRKRVARNRRRLHNECFHNLYVSPNIIRVTKSGRMTWMGHVARMGQIRNWFKILVGNSERKRPRGRRRRRWEDNIRMDLRRRWVGRCGLDSPGSG
jgi:hypothetical protein